MPHLHREGDRIRLIVDGEPRVLLAGEVHNSSSSSLTYMERSWDRMVEIGCDTALVPVSWEQIEPEEGRFDFVVLDGLLAGAREHGLRLVLLWFGTWKNASSSYAPAWVKRNLARFPRAQVEPGVNKDAITCLSRDAREADARAFAALMGHLRAVDEGTHTVLAVQVENETGLLGGARDRCALAEAAYRAPVDLALSAHLLQHREDLVPELMTAWTSSGARAEGTWPEVFGEIAAEAFMAWQVGSFVGAVAAAGKAEYALPMYANAWLRGPGQAPGVYPSGGPLPWVRDLWQAAAPSIDFLAPDIYLPAFRDICAEYRWPGNPLFIPEAAIAVAPATVFHALAGADALCFAPFGIDGEFDWGPLQETYRFLRGMLPVILEYQGTGRMVGLLQEREAFQSFELGGYRLTARFHRSPEAPGLPGRGLVVALGEGNFLVAGADLDLSLEPRSAAVGQVEFLRIEEGTYEDGRWVPGRWLNGDELHLRLGPELCARRFSVFLR
jgi:hypothetical protein